MTSPQTSTFSPPINLIIAISKRETFFGHLRTLDFFMYFFRFAAVDPGFAEVLLSFHDAWWSCVKAGRDSNYGRKHNNEIYHLAINIFMENCICSIVESSLNWQCSIAILNHHRVTQNRVLRCLSIGAISSAHNCGVFPKI